jgi:predicted O-methyltransferase YrrM
VRLRGLIAIDNAPSGGSEARPAIDADIHALQKLNAKVSEDERVDMAPVAIEDGLKLVRRR